MLRRAPVLLAPLLLLAACQGGPPTPTGGTGSDVRARHGVVVSETPAASRIGADILERGGSAVDAAIAVAFALAVTWPEAGNVAGGGFMLVHPGRSKEPVCFDYRETAPAAATVTTFSGGGDRYGCKAVGVPGTVRGLALAHRRHGRLAWAELVLPAADLAERGFEVDRHLAASANRVLERPEVRGDARYAELRRVYGRPGGGPWKEGDRMVLPDLATTLRLIAVQGPDGFYGGRVADAIAGAMERGGGLITRADLAGYRAVERVPVQGSYRGYGVLGAPPPASGGICLVQMLNVLERFDLGRHPRWSARVLHLMAEAARRAYRDRARHLGDPAFTTTPQHLATKPYATTLAREIDVGAATPSESLAKGIALAEESDSTTHFSIVDTDGMAVANTYTLEASWGSRIVVPGTGVLLNNEMGDFNWYPGRTTRSGGIGTDPNLIAPGKRMLSSQCPTILTRDGRPFLVTGSPGGRAIINTVLGIVVSVIDHELDLAQAIRGDRHHHQWFPDRLELEDADAPRHRRAVAALEAMGHDVRPSERFRGQGSAHTILIDPETGHRRGVADHRRGGAASGY